MCHVMKICTIIIEKYTNTTETQTKLPMCSCSPLLKQFNDWRPTPESCNEFRSFTTRIKKNFSLNSKLEWDFPILIKVIYFELKYLKYLNHCCARWQKSKSLVIWIVRRARKNNALWKQLILIYRYCDSGSGSNIFQQYRE